MSEYQDLSSLSDFTIFYDKYKEAAGAAASAFGYTAAIDKDAVKRAHDRFVIAAAGMFDHLDQEQKKPIKWQNRLTTTIALLIRTTSAFEITKFTSDVDTVHFRAQEISRHRNELCGLAMAIGVFSVEISQLYRNDGLYAANYDALKYVRWHEISRYLKIIVDDRRFHYNERGPIFRKDFRRLIKILRVVIDIRMASISAA